MIYRLTSAIMKKVKELTFTNGIENNIEEKKFEKQVFTQWFMLNEKVQLWTLDKKSAQWSRHFDFQKEKSKENLKLG